MISVSLSNYTVESITLYDKQYTSGYTESYSDTDEDQSQAFEILESCCDEEDIVSSVGGIKEAEDKQLSGVDGPKRIEVTLRKFGMIPGEIKLVVTDVVAPTGFYRDYSVSGREWSVPYKELTKGVTTMWGHGVWISRLDTHLAQGSGSANEHFTVQDQPKAWDTLHERFSKYKHHEIQLIKNWTVSEDIGLDPDWGYGEGYAGPINRSQHWTNRTPSNYGPKEAHYRVSGDEVGAVLYRKQKEAWEEEGRPDPEQSLQKMLESVKDSKESDPEPEANTQRVCSDCGGTGCDETYCNSEFGLGGWIGNLAGIPRIH